MKGGKHLNEQQRLTISIKKIRALAAKTDSGQSDKFVTDDGYPVTYYAHPEETAKQVTETFQRCLAKAKLEYAFKLSFPLTDWVYRMNVSDIFDLAVTLYQEISDFGGKVKRENPDYASSLIYWLLHGELITLHGEVLFKKSTVYGDSYILRVFNPRDRHHRLIPKYYNPHFPTPLLPLPDNLKITTTGTSSQDEWSIYDLGEARLQKEPGITVLKFDPTKGEPLPPPYTN